MVKCYTIWTGAERKCILFGVGIVAAEKKKGKKENCAGVSVEIYVKCWCGPNLWFLSAALESSGGYITQRSLFTIRLWKQKSATQQ